RTREKNISFHRLLAQGSKNVIFIMLHESLMQILSQFLSKFESPPDHSKRVLENHWRTLRHLKEGNLEMASLAMRDHIHYVGNRMKSLLEGDSKAMKGPKKTSSLPKREKS
ncbi:MAG: FCD domain-containing protein, partial [Pseudomonadota bacterium]